MPLKTPLAAAHTNGWCRVGHYAATPTTTITVDGQAIPAYPGESLLAALLTANITTLRHSPADNTARSAFCLMGSCQECLLHVDAIPLLACMEPVTPGMRVTTDRLARAPHPGEPP